MRKIQKTCMFTILAVIVFMFLFICVRAVTRQVLVNRFALSEPVVDLILFDLEDLKNNGETTDKAQIVESNQINWTELYPFEDKNTIKDNSANNVSGTDTDKNDATDTTGEKRTLLSRRLSYYNDVISVIKDSVEKYCTDYLPWYKSITTAANGYENLIQWNFVDYNEYNGIVKLSDGSLTSYLAKQEVSECAESLKALHDCSTECGAEFIYIQAPYKICQFEDESVSGSLDFSNQNANALLKALSEMNVDTLDLRELIHQEGLNHHSMFYRTDHHWKVESGFWAADRILSLLQEKYGFNVETGLLKEDLFTKKYYEKWFLGSQGKKVTLAGAVPDDFTIYYPNFETSLHYVIPSLKIDVSGDFSVTYDMSQVEELDYYNKSPYQAYNYADQPLIQITNRLSSNDTRILLIRDSFGSSVISFLALGVKDIDVIDLRHFTGSLEAYIKDTDPQIVIVMYNPGAIVQPIDWTEHKDLFDFR